MQIEERSERRRGLGFLCAGLVVALALYAAIGIHLSSLRAFWSSDMGPRWAMIQSWTHGGNLIYPPYRNADVDPSGQFHPLGLLTSTHLDDGYILRLSRGFCTHFPPLFALLSGIVYRIAGYYGLTALPCLAGVLTLWITCLIAGGLGLRSRLLILPVLGLATPLLIYAGLFWDHAIHMMICAAAALMLLDALQTGRIRYGMAAGALLGLGIFFHELFGLLFAALLAGSIVVLRAPAGRRAVCGAIAGFAPMLLLWLLTNMLLYGLPFGPHLVVASHIRHSPQFAHEMSAAPAAARALSQLLGYDPDWKGRKEILVVLALLFGWAGCVAAGDRLLGDRLLGGKLLGVAPLLLLPAAAVMLAWLVKSTWAFGLFQATPLLFAAIAWPPRDPPGPSAESRTALCRWLFTAWILFMAVVADNPQDPGLNWGSRYMLTTLPWAVLLAARNLESLFERTAGIYRYGSPLAASLLVATGLYANVRGVSRIASDEARSLPTAGVFRTTAPVVVFGNFFVACESVEIPHQRLFAVRSPEKEGEDFYRCLDRLNADSFTYYGEQWYLDRMRLAGLQHTPQYVAVRAEPPPAVGIRFQRQEAPNK
jgi:hypothetical protein